MFVTLSDCACICVLYIPLSFLGTLTSTIPSTQSRRVAVSIQRRRQLLPSAASEIANLRHGCRHLPLCDWLKFRRTGACMMDCTILCVFIVFFVFTRVNYKHREPFIDVHKSHRVITSVILRGTDWGWCFFQQTRESNFLAHASRKKNHRLLFNWGTSLHAVVKLEKTEVLCSCASKKFLLLDFSFQSNMIPVAEISWSHDRLLFFHSKRSNIFIVDNRSA